MKTTPEDVLIADITRRLHEFLFREIDQFDNIKAGKARSDKGYPENIDRTAKEIIALVRDYDLEEFESIGRNHE